MSSSKSFESEVESSKFYNKTVAEKLKKGYAANNTTSAPVSASAAATSAATVYTTPCTPSFAIPLAKAAAKDPAKPSAKATAATGLKSYLVCQEGNSDKFYEISCDGSEVAMRYGKNGTEANVTLVLLSVTREVSFALCSYLSYA